MILRYRFVDRFGTPRYKAPFTIHRESSLQRPASPLWGRSVVQKVAREISNGAQRAGRAIRRCSSGVEQLICNQQVVGSTPTIGFTRGGGRAERYPSGQREQTVNLPANAYGGSNPPLPTTAAYARRGAQKNIRASSGSSSVARASAFQAEGRGFESRFPLQIHVGEGAQVAQW